jgi:hypothetical protein
MARRDYWQAEAQAGEVLAKKKISALPVDPFAIAASEGIVCEKLRSASTGVSGCLSGAGDAFGIFYSDAISSEGFRRFTVAHDSWKATTNTSSQTATHGTSRTVVTPLMIRSSAKPMRLRRRC